jgi:hypothetical protein
MADNMIGGDDLPVLVAGCNIKFICFVLFTRVLGKWNRFLLSSNVQTCVIAKGFVIHKGQCTRVISGKRFGRGKRP